MQNPRSLTSLLIVTQSATVCRALHQYSQQRLLNTESILQTLREMNPSMTCRTHCLRGMQFDFLSQGSWLAAEVAFTC